MSGMQATPERPRVDPVLSRIADCRHGKMIFLASDSVIGRALELYGEFAESENRLMSSLLGAGEVAVDIGANIGTVTLPLARRVGPSGRIYAFEPQRIIFQHLCADAVLNGLTNIDARETAVGAATATARIPELNPAAAANFGAVRLAADAAGELVPLVRLDDLDLAQCRLIKIDVEGGEFDVLQGAEETIARHRPFIYFEAKSGDGTRACLSWLFARSYRLYWHFAMFFEASNFRGNGQNVFGAAGDINALAIPGDKTMTVPLPQIAGPDSDWKADYEAWLASRRTET